MKHIIFLSLLTSWASAAPEKSTVIQILADQVFALASMEKAGDWNLDDKVCITREKDKIACGIIVMASAKVAKVKVNFQFKTIKIGDLVVVDDNTRSPASLDSTSEMSVDPGSSFKYNILTGVKQNLTAAIPFIHIQVISNNHLSLGVQIDKVAIKIADSTNIVSALGATFNANYYGDSPFRGFWFQAGTGFHILPTTSTGLAQTSYSPAIVGLVGWRNKWALGLNIGIAVGVQYFLLPAGIATEFTFNPIQPLISVDIGFNM